MELDRLVVVGHLEATVSQLSYAGLSFGFMKSRKLST